MIGGIVLEVCNVPGRDDVLFVEVGERPYSVLQKSGVLVENNANAKKIEIGDSLWWQSGMCMWTPQDNRAVQGAKILKGGIDYDIQIPKRSNSGCTFEMVCQKD